MNQNINLGQLIPSSKIRKGIWAGWVLLTLIVGAIPAAYTALSLQNPDWLEAAWAVIAYLNIPLATLALVNTPTEDEGDEENPDEYAGGEHVI